VGCHQPLEDRLRDVLGVRDHSGNPDLPRGLEGVVQRGATTDLTVSLQPLHVPLGMEEVDGCVADDPPLAGEVLETAEGGHGDGHQIGLSRKASRSCWVSDFSSRRRRIRWSTVRLARMRWMTTGCFWPCRASRLL